LEKIIRVHGDLTFGENGKFGFDTHHMGDISPVDETMAVKAQDERMRKVFQTEPLFGNQKHYWTFEQVKEEVKYMAEQFKERE
jgi:hypothetical protein